MCCRKGSLKVEYHVNTAKDSQLITKMTALSKNMATGKSKVTYEGQEVTVSSVTLVDTSGNARKLHFISLTVKVKNCQFHLCL